ncbi:MAG: class I SAM-dependent methyltransferase [Planctomycetota bacterium]|jgi:SAM-dependent methyltransferase
MSDAWHEDDALWEQLAPALFPKRHWERAETEVQQIVDLLDLSAGASVLDLACGPGRHALELARRGFRVTAVDRTKAYLKQARRRADDEGLAIELIESDMRTFRRPETFDLVINMYTSFGYFDEPSDDRLVAGNAFASLKAGGRLVMELFGKELTAADFRSRDWDELDDGALFLQERTVEDHWRSLRNRWILIRGHERREFHFSLRPYSAGELMDLLGRAGFGETVAYGSLAGDPYDNTAKRLVIVATK